MSYPKYSVLMSVYIKENPQYLRQAIDSMLSQTIKPDEFIVVEDGPLTCELYEVLDDYEKQYGKLFNRIKNEKNLGLGLALNRGLKFCKNEWIARMDSDDISFPYRCEKQLQKIKSDSDLSIIGGDISEFIGEVNDIVDYRIVPKNDDMIKRYLKKRNPMNHVTVMYKKEAVESVGGYLDWLYHEDYYLWIRMSLANKKFANIDDILVNVRVGEDMYRRRGGWKYFKSAAKLQKYMKDNKIIGFGTYFINVTQRFILQVLMPNWLRGWVFKKFARKKG